MVYDIKVMSSSTWFLSNVNCFSLDPVPVNIKPVFIYWWTMGINGVLRTEAIRVYQKFLGTVGYFYILFNISMKIFK